jgi:hypothetical protein
VLQKKERLEQTNSFAIPSKFKSIYGIGLTTKGIIVVAIQTAFPGFSTETLIFFESLLRMD